MPRQPKRHDGIDASASKRTTSKNVVAPNVDDVFAAIRKFAADWFAPVSD
jgi:hypothetical protein